MLLDRLMTMAGLPMDEDRLDPEGFMAAMVARFSGATGALERAVRG